MRFKNCQISVKKIIVLVFLFQFIIFSNRSSAETMVIDLNIDREENLKKDEVQKKDEVLTVKVIGTTFRGLARSFVAVTDINKLREYNIAKLEKMDDNKFNKKYKKVYDILKDLPEDVKLRYSISSNMSREQAIINLKTLNKKEIYALIDAIPNSVIANAFYKNYKQENRYSYKAEAMSERIKTIWNNILNRTWFEKNKI